MVLVNIAYKGYKKTASLIAQAFNFRFDTQWFCVIPLTQEQIGHLIHTEGQNPAFVMGPI